MGQRLNVAAMMDAPTLPRKEEYAKGMGHRPSVAAMMDAPTLPRGRKDFVIGMG